MQNPFDIVLRLATPHLQARMHLAPFAAGDILAEAGTPVRSAIFLLTGVASAMVTIERQAIDVGFARPEVVIGPSDLPDHFVTWIARQDGRLCSMPIDDLLALKAQHYELLDAVSRGNRFLQMQAQHLAACNSRHKASYRLASFLLRTRDFYATDEMYFKQDILAAALSLQRSTVSHFASALDDLQIIRFARGRIQILDVERLEAKACECHRSIREQYHHIFNRPMRAEAARGSS